jgi:membrane AbrB-like protein
MELTQPPLLPGRLAGRTRALQWGFIAGLSLVFATILELAHLPAALLVGPMLAATLAGINGASVRVPRRAFGAAQAVVGCLIAASIEPEILSAFVDDWPLFLAAVLATVAASSLLGYLISRWRVLPGTTAVWGSAPGAATAMVLMADAFGADARLVAFMQYLRVIFVSVAAALIARTFVHSSGVEAPTIVWFPPIDWPAFATTIVVATVGGALGYLIRLPSPFFLGAMLLGAALHLGLGLDLQLPEWLLAASYALVGWSIGLNFNRLILRHAARAASDRNVDLGPHDFLRRACLVAHPLRRHRSADGLSGDQPRWHGFRRDHRRGFAEREPLLYHGAANGAFPLRAGVRASDFPARGKTSSLIRFRCVRQPAQSRRNTADAVLSRLSQNPSEVAARSAAERRRYGSLQGWRHDDHSKPGDTFNPPWGRSADSCVGVPGAPVRIVFLTLGMRASTSFDIGGVLATARMTLGWRHAFGDTTPLATQAIAGGDALFTVSGAPIARQRPDGGGP